MEEVINDEGRSKTIRVTEYENMGISVPMWLSKNTREFARYKWTTFNADQFFEPVSFDRFEIRLEENI